MVFIVGSFNTISDISNKTLIFLILSGLATGGSWLCYFKASSFFIIIIYVPIPIAIIPSIFVNLRLSPSIIDASIIVSTVLDLSIGVTLFTSPS